MGVDDVARRSTVAIESFPDAVKECILRILDMTDDRRASAIGELYQDKELRQLAELLIDLEVDPSIRKLVAAMIRGQLRPARGIQDRSR
jgi:hypothetical protein